MEKESIYTSISKYFNEGCTQEEIVSILEWCNQSEENKNEFIQLKKIWVVSNKKDEDRISFLLPKIWGSIVTNITKQTPKVYTKRSLLYYTVASAVAAIVLMFGFNMLINDKIWSNDIEYANFYMPRGEKGQVYLPDGTKVWLNSDSKLTFGNDFNSKNRMVILEGEAYFDVAKNDKYKFVVKTALVDVKVHGTAFNITAYSDSEDVDIFLQRGSVSIYESESEKELASLTSNQHVSINKNSLITQLSEFEDDSDIAWTFDQLIFDHTPLNEVISKMENWYDVNILILKPSKQENLKYRFKIKSESLTEILELINKMTPIEYKIDGKEVIISYK